MTGNYKALVDDQGVPIRIKASAIASILGAVITVGTLLATAGAKSERLNALDKRTSALELLPPRISTLEAHYEEILRRLENSDGKLDRILERRAR